MLDEVLPARIGQRLGEFASELLAGEGTGVLGLFEERGVFFEEGGDLLFGVGEDLIGGLGARYDPTLDADGLGGLGDLTLQGGLETEQGVEIFAREEAACLLLYILSTIKVGFSHEAIG
jgi:hypothetical protein